MDTPGDGTLDGGEPALSASAGLETLVGSDTQPSLAQPGPSLNEDPSHIGRYVVLRRVGEGGMGVVYAAYDNELERRVAVKLVHHSRVNADTRARVRREAQALARLSHPNVVQVYEVGEFDGQVFVVMEFITGPTLAEWAQALDPGPERWRRVLDTYIDVGRGLEAAHAARIVHRDFKPANAIVGDDGRVRVLDFGIARAAEGSNSGLPGSHDSDRKREREHARAADRTDSSSWTGSRADSPAGTDAGELEAQTDTLDSLSAPLTQTGAMVGTPAYMSPEQFERGSVDARSDQFSFCVSLYEALYGERPFAGSNPATLMFAILAGELRPAPSKSGVPVWVRELLARGLATKPEQRWPSMTELLGALARDPEARRRRQRRRLIRLSLVGLAVAALVWFARVQMRSAEAADRAKAQAQASEAIAQARKAEAQAQRDRALAKAQANAMRSRDTARVLAARLSPAPDIADALLRDVERPGDTPGWRPAAVMALQHPVSRRILDGHGGRLNYLDISADGRWIASSSFDHTARLWPREGGEPIILEHDDAVFAASFSRRGDKLVTGCRDGRARVFTLPPRDAPAPDDGRPPSLAPPLVLEGHDDMLWSAQFSPSGSKVVTASRDSTARVWSLDDPSHPVVFEHPPINKVWWAELSADDRWLVTAADDGARLFCVHDPSRPPIFLEGSSERVGDVHFSPDMRTIVSASDDGYGRLYPFDPEALDADPTLTSLPVSELLVHDNDIYRIRFAPGGLRFVTASRDGSAKVWTPDGLGHLAAPPQVFTTHDATKQVWSADFSPDGRYLAMGLGNGEVQIQPLEGGPRLILRGHTADVFRVRFTPDGRSLFSASSDGDVREWGTEWGHNSRTLTGHRDRVTALESRGSLLATGSLDGDVRLWPVTDPGPGLAVAAGPVVLSGHREHPVIAFDSFPRLVATADDVQAQIRLWQVTGTWVLDPERPLATLETPAAVRNLVIDPLDELLVAGLVDGTLLVWELAQLDQPARVVGHFPTSTQALIPLVFPRTGEYLAAGTGMGEVGVWPRAQLFGDAPLDPAVALPHTGRVHDLKIGPDNRTLVAVSLDESATINQLTDAFSFAGEPTRLDHGYFVFRAAIHPEGHTIATGCGDTLVYLWSVEDPREPTLLRGAGGEVRDLAFSPDGDLIAGASQNGQVWIWPLAGGDALELDMGAPVFELEFVDNGRRIAGAGFSPDPMLWYLGDELDPDTLHARLTAATELCLSPDQRALYIGETPMAAAAAHAACLRAMRDQGR